MISRCCSSGPVTLFSTICRKVRRQRREIDDLLTADSWPTSNDRDIFWWDNCHAVNNRFSVVCVQTNPSAKGIHIDLLGGIRTAGVGFDHPRCLGVGPSG